MKTLITGGAGFIGSHIQDRLIALGHEVAIIDNLRSGKRKNIHPQSVFYQADICDQSAVERAFKQFQPEAVFHLAAQNEVPYSMYNPFEDQQTNIVGMMHILEACRKYHVKKIIYSNTGGAFYGKVPDDKLPITEEEIILKPTSFYGVSKLCAEYYMKLYGHLHNLSWVALRYSNVYGPRQEGNSETGVIAVFTSQLLQNIAPTINGDGKNTRDYVYVDDVVDANIQAFSYEHSDYFNIATGTETSNNELYRLLAGELKTNIAPHFGPPRPGDIWRSSLSIQKAEKILQWKPKTRQTIEYYRTKDKNKVFQEEYPTQGL
jgi:UDP-glucose 4-epimerase